MAIWPFRRSRAESDAARLLGAVTAASRNPALFGAGRVHDTLEGRFELMTLHAALALMRLQREPALEPLAQAFTDRLFRQFDAGLREAGVGDTSVPKRMRRMAGDFYGRLRAYADALSETGNGTLADALARNVLGGHAPDFARELANYARTAAAAQAAAPVEALMGADGWPPLES